MTPVNVWTLVYRTDQDGNPLLGDVIQLRNAVLAGADIKVVYQPRSGRWWSRSCSSATVSGSGSATVVSAVYMEAADTAVTPRGLTFAEPFAVEYQIYNSIGTRALAKSVDGQIVAADLELVALSCTSRTTSSWNPAFPTTSSTRSPTASRSHSSSVRGTSGYG